ncbi:MAG: phosphoribosylanthranilate isomerase [Candidatus Lokiarchaeota archaeon]|nr:phosphoribosylanthranilate isomerase [Candidatus Lokiarchaeota archaeon]
MVEIKICGVRDEAIAAVAVESGATYVGIVTGAPDSPRHVDRAAAKGLIQFLRGKASSVLVTRVLTRHFIALASAAKPDLVQFHEPIPASGLGELRHGYGGRIIFGISPRSTTDSLLSIAPSFGEEDIVLVDGSKGTGTGIDEHALIAVSDLTKEVLGLSMKDLLVAGGLSASNVGAFLERHAPRGVDASSGLETTPGVKDPALIKKFCLEIKKASIIHD